MTINILVKKNKKNIYICFSTFFYCSIYEKHIGPISNPNSELLSPISPKAIS